MDTTDDENTNTFPQIMKFLSTDERPVKTSEFTEFWKSLTDEEKNEFRSAKLQ